MNKVIIPFLTSEKTPYREVLLNKSVLRLNSFGEIPTICSNKPPKILGQFEFLKIDEKYFNRSRFCNYAIDNTECDKFLILDAEIIAPENFLKETFEIVKNGTIFFPIVYCLHKDKDMKHLGDGLKDYSANGYWLTGGYGLFAMTKTDWNKSMGLNEKIGETYGVEDIDFYNRMKTKLEVIRYPFKELFHQWHLNTVEEKTANNIPNQDISGNFVIGKKLKLQEGYYN